MMIYWRENMRRSALALVLIGTLVAISFVTIGGTETAEAEMPAGPEEPTKATEPHNKQDAYPEWSSWNAEDHTKPWNQPWHNYTNYMKYYEQREFWLRCKNMTEDYQWLDDVNDTTNGDEPGLMKEDLNLTQNEGDPMNFSYPRSDKLLTAQYDTSMNDLGVLNFTINPLGINVNVNPLGNPLMGKDKLLQVEVWVDVDGDYDYIDPDPDAAIEGRMRFDFNWWDTPFDPLDPSGTIDPYRTKAKQMQNPPVGRNQQMEEYMDGIGYWLDTDDDGRPNIPGDINGGRIWVLIWREDNQPDDYDNRTMDLLVYCGYNEKLSWITLPYKHPKQLPVADTGEDRGFPENKEDFLRPVSDPRHESPEFTEANPQIKEGDIIVFDGTGSYDPQDDVGQDGIGYGDPEWTGPDIGEGNENIDDGFPEGEPDYGETDTLFYKWDAETSIDDRNFNVPLSTGWDTSPMLEWKVRLPAMDPDLPADQQFQILNVTLTVRDRDNYQGTDTIKLLAFKSQNPPVVSITAVPQIPKEFGRDNVAYVLPQQEIELQGYAYDPDPNSELSYYWKFESEWNIFYREGATILTEYFEEPGTWNITLTVYDGPLDNINTLNGTDNLVLHVIENTEPVPIIRAGFKPILIEESSYHFESINTSKNRMVYFNGSFSYDPDVLVPENKTRSIEEHWQGLPGFDEDLDGVPDIELKYQWDWGDGSRTESFSSNPEGEHKWSDRGASSKNKLFWPVVLKVWDGSTITESEEFRVYVNLPPIADAGPNQPGPGEEEIETGTPVFFNGKGSYDPNDDPNYDGKRAGGEYNDNLLYIWDFDDGSPTVTGMTPNHTYESPGTYEVVLTVKDTKFSDDDTMKVKVVPANQPPVGVVEINADSWINIDDREVFTNVAMTFDASQSFDPDGEFYNDDLASTSQLDDLYNLTWDLGDSTVSKQPTVQHVYEDNGVYTVKLSMQDIKGAVWEQEYEINVANRAPVAIILDDELTYTMSEQPVMLSGEGSFDDDGEVIGYYWDFGDGTHSDLNTGIDGYQSAMRTSHEYERTGTYTVTLRVMDDDGAKTPPEEAAEVTVLIKAEPQEEETPIPAGIIIGGIAATAVIMTVGSSLFAGIRKRL